MARVNGKTLTQEEVIEDFIKVHGTTYNYSQVVYINNHTRVTIGCPRHKPFTISPAHHKNGRGCPKCGNTNRAKSKRDTTESIIAKFVKLHGARYDYGKVVYSSSRELVKVICTEHGVFPVSSNNHLKGRGCPLCSTEIYGIFNKAIPAMLYYLSIDGGVAYKIGITNRTVEERYDLEELVNIEIVDIKLFDVGAKAYEAEQSILTKYTADKYIGKQLLKSGNTELFNRDILGGKLC